MDNWVTRDARPGEVFELLMEAYAGHDFPHNPLTSGTTGPVLPGMYEERADEGGRADPKLPCRAR